jgi:hypothetical protein
MTVPVGAAPATFTKTVMGLPVNPGDGTTDVMVVVDGPPAHAGPLKTVNPITLARMPAAIVAPTRRRPCTVVFLVLFPT